MKKVYWISISLALFCAVLDVVFASLQLVVPAMITAILIIVFALLGLVLYMCFVKFKCPKCNTIFKGKSWEIFFAPHTPTKRYMRCPMCHERLWCEDVFDSKRRDCDLKE